MVMRRGVWRMSVKQPSCGLHDVYPADHDRVSTSRDHGLASEQPQSGANTKLDGLPLSGITVVEFAHSVAGPYAGSILADLGADVIKVESPDSGDYARDWGPPFAHGTSTLFHVLNHNKRALALDLRDRVTAERL